MEIQQVKTMSGKVRTQTGLAIVEFAFIGLLFFVVLLGAIETGRWFFTYNALAEAARLGARALAVCGVDQLEEVRNITRFNAGNVLPADLTDSHIVAEALDDKFNVLETNTFINIRYVRLRIQAYQYALFIPIPGLSPITMPDFSTTRPRESLGAIPNPTDGSISAGMC